jgi:ribosome-binding ATPase YchF (GTP1/OBG family)
MCTIGDKVRHLYDVVRLSELDEIKHFLNDKDPLKEIVTITKETDHVYFEKRRIAIDYNPKSSYDYHSWKEKLTDEVKRNYENLHNTLLYTNLKQDWNMVDAAFGEIDRILSDIQE